MRRAQRHIGNASRHCAQTKAERGKAWLDANHRNLRQNTIAASTTRWVASMPIEIMDAARSTSIVIATVLAALLLSLRPSRHRELFPVSVTQELKGLAILSIVFAHISYMLVTDSRFLYPLSIAAGVGVDLFLFISGFGLTLGMLRKRLSPAQFYRRRLSRVFIPFWLVILLLFAADAVFLGKYYTPSYMLQSFFGWFPQARSFEDVNSPFWYITWILLFYALFPLLFSSQRPWLSALALAVIANVLAITDPLQMQSNWLHRLHTNAFSLGMIAAWLLQSRPAMAATLLRLRDDERRWPRLLAASVALLAALCIVPFNSARDWPRLAEVLLAAGFDPEFFVQQAVGLLTMTALLALFMMKRRDSLLLHLFGVYSYEIYLLHWPLMSRYDPLYALLPAWLATLAWLAAFIACGWVVRRMVTPVEALVDRNPAPNPGR